MTKNNLNGKWLNTGRTHFKKGVPNNVGKNNPMWKGGEYKSKDGYILTLCPKEFISMKRKSNNYILKHRLIMAQELKRPLLRSEVVHHINGVKDDNDINNLELLNHGEHTTLHCKKVERLFCIKCGKEIIKDLRAGRKFCSRKCYHSHK